MSSGTANDAAAALPYRADIDGLRAIAVLSVLAFHAFPDLLPGGFIGVDVFFVISGYLITRNILTGIGAGSFRFGDFYARRARRLFPALGVVLLACVAAGWLCLSPEEYAQLGRHAAAGAAFVSNFASAGEAGYFDSAADLKPLLHLWSLGIEEQFYLCWPVLLWVGANTGAKNAETKSRGDAALLLCLLATVTSFALNLHLSLVDPSTAYYFPFSRFWELTGGAALAIATSTAAPSGSAAVRALASAAGAALIVAGLALINETLRFPGWWALLPVAGTVLCIGAGPAAPVNRLLGLGLPNWLGRISYPLYLWHWPLLVFPRLLTGETPDWEMRLALLALAVVLAQLTYALVEKPLRLRLRLRTAVAGSSLLLAATGCAALAVSLLQGMATRFPPEINRALVAGETQADQATLARTGLCQKDHGGKRPPACVEPGRPLLLVWGDSHAVSLLLGLRLYQQEQKRRFALAQFTGSGCPPFPGFTRAMETGCEETNVEALEAVRRYHPETVLLTAYWGRPGYELYDMKTGRLDTAPLQAAIDALRAAGARQIVLAGPLPTWTDPLSEVIFLQFVHDPLHRIPPARLKYRLRPGLWEMDGALRRFAARQGLRYISPASVLCNDEGCLSRTGPGDGKLTSLDYGHLTTSAAAYVIERMADAIFQASPAAPAIPLTPTPGVPYPARTPADARGKN